MAGPGGLAASRKALKDISIEDVVDKQTAAKGKGKGKGKRHQRGLVLTVQEVQCLADGASH